MGGTAIKSGKNRIHSYNKSAFNGKCFADFHYNLMELGAFGHNVPDESNLW